MPTIENAADQQGDRGGDDAAEDEEEEQGQQREGDQLGRGQVLAGLVVGLVEALREAALGDVERAGVGQRLDPFGGEAAGVLDVVGREVASDRQRLAVFGDQLGAGAGVAQRVDDPTDVLDLCHAVAEPVDLAPNRGVGEVEPAALGRADDEDDRRVGVVAESVAEQVGCRSLSELGLANPAAFKWCSTSWPKATAKRAKAPTAASTSFGCFQVRLATRVKRGGSRRNCTRIQSDSFELPINQLLSSQLWVPVNTASPAALPVRLTASASAGRC